MSIISISNLSFAYQKGVPIINGLNLNVDKGSIYGFLGKNGAGKSTTIRTMLGLLNPSNGSVRLFDKEVQKNRPSIFQKIGTLIESPSLYAQLNAIDHLRIGAKYTGASSKKIETILKQVNLFQHRKKATRKYSTGMKQRLGLALALLNDPELLILDEPTNGLDPTGIIEIRNILLDLSAAGKTILLSSHQLAEVERIATHVGILNDGKIIFEGTISELENYKRANNLVKIQVANPEDVSDVFLPYDIQQQEGKNFYVQLSDADDLPKLIRQLVERGVDLYEVSPMKSDLEKLFIDITND